jgi:adenine-specific DNA-methyltransferase
MKEVSQFGTVDAWRVALGFMPVPFRDSDEIHAQYVLMNGTSGNFCLDFVGIGDSNTQRAAAWSCDVGHYVTFGTDSVVVRRWARGAPEETYSTQSVVAQIHEFHRYLEKNTPDRAQSIAAHVLRIFRRVRAVENDGYRSLRVLLHLLASCAADQERISEKDFSFWGLAPETADITKQITDATWRPLHDDLSGIGRYDILHPDFGLVLRHASGAVFQDAHLEAEGSTTLWLPGIEGPAIIDARSVPNEAGIYFTPPALARTLAEEITRCHVKQPNAPLFIFDPACGSGELLKECLRQLKPNPPDGQIRILGWDKSQGAVDMARFVLSWEARSWPAGRVEFDIVKQDSVTAEIWPDGVGILVMNPPFRSWNLMTDEEKALARTLLGSSYKPNLAMIFAFRALKALGSGGTLAMIAPTSLLEGTSAKFLREQLAEALAPQLIARLGEQSIFARALVDAGMYVGSKPATKESTTAVLWADSSPHSLNSALRGLRQWRGAQPEPINESGFSIYERNDIARTGGPWIARRYTAWRSYEAIRTNRLMIPARKVFDIKLGVRLGNDVFIISKDAYQELPNGERRFFRPAVMNPSISDGTLSDSYYVFYPHTAGLPTIKQEQDLVAHVPFYFKEYLFPAKDKLAARKTLARAGQNWWELLEHRAWLEAPRPKIVSKYFGGRRSFAFDKGGTYVVVVGSGWLLEKGALQTEITDDEVYLATLAYLSSTIAEGLLKYVSIQVSGGQADLTKKYVGQLPIPNLAKVKRTEMNRLVEMGAAIMDKRVENWADVDELVLSILGE